MGCTQSAGWGKSPRFTGGRAYSKSPKVSDGGKQSLGRRIYGCRWLLGADTHSQRACTAATGFEKASAMRQSPQASSCCVGEGSTVDSQRAGAAAAVAAAAAQPGCLVGIAPNNNSYVSSGKKQKNRCRLRPRTAFGGGAFASCGPQRRVPAPVAVSPRVAAARSATAGAGDEADLSESFTDAVRP